MIRRNSRFVRVWAGPLLLGAVSAAALYLALVFDGWLDVVCGILLFAVGCYGITFYIRRS